jgi:hypothetical protein
MKIMFFLCRLERIQEEAVITYRRHSRMFLKLTGISFPQLVQRIPDNELVTLAINSSAHEILGGMMGSILVYILCVNYSLHCALCIKILFSLKL